jgi:hypothetical protein
VVTLGGFFIPNWVRADNEGGGFGGYENPLIRRLCVEVILEVYDITALGNGVASGVRFQN